MLINKKIKKNIIKINKIKNQNINILITKDKNILLNILILIKNRVIFNFYNDN